jgi:hypothetical protein
MRTHPLSRAPTRMHSTHMTSRCSLYMHCLACSSLFGTRRHRPPSSMLCLPAVGQSMAFQDASSSKHAGRSFSSHPLQGVARGRPSGSARCSMQPCGSRRTQRLRRTPPTRPSFVVHPCRVGRAQREPRRRSSAQFTQLAHNADVAAAASRAALVFQHLRGRFTGHAALLRECATRMHPRQQSLPHP